MGNEIVQYEGMGSSITLWREPEQVLADAKKAADALVSVIKQKEKPVTFNGETYLEREDWGTVAKFYGCTAKSISTNYVNYDGVRGFEAVAVCIDANLNEIGRAESMCLSDEDNWGDVPVYGWEDELDENGKKIWDVKLRSGKGGYKGKRVQLGSKPKPLFQLRSMAQTRAEAKVLKSVFGYVVVLAGYKPTPAEEMTRAEERFEDRVEKKPPIQQPQRASEKAAQQTQQTSAKEADTKTQTTSGSTTGGSAAATSQDAANEISGVIESIKESNNKNGTYWMNVGKRIVMIPADKMDSDMRPGVFLKGKGTKRHSDKVGDYWVLTALIELSPVEDGTVEPEKNAPLTEDAEKAAAEMFGKEPQGGQAAVAEMVKNGDLKPASALPETAQKKPGSIGLKRATRLYTLCSQNKKTNNGFNEAEIKKILTVLYPEWPENHLRDLEVGKYEQFEKWAVGEEDFQEFWKD